MATLDTLGTAQNVALLIGAGSRFDLYTADNPTDLFRLQNFTLFIASIFGLELFYDLPNIYTLLVTDRRTIPGVVYFISRVTALTTVIFCIQSMMTIDHDCQHSKTGVEVSSVLASAATTLLFGLRVHALYREKPSVIRSFAFLWLCAIGGAVSLSLPISVDYHVTVFGQHAWYCLGGGAARIPLYTIVSVIIPALYDTAVFCAVSYRLFPEYKFDGETAWKERLRLFFSGQGLPRLSKALLQGGQQYYLISTTVNILTTIFHFKARSFLVAYHVVMILIITAVTNSMACKVFRDIRFGRYSGMPVSLPGIDTGSIAFATRSLPS